MFEPLSGRRLKEKCFLPMVHDPWYGNSIHNERRAEMTEGAKNENACVCFFHAGNSY